MDPTTTAHVNTVRLGNPMMPRQPQSAVAFKPGASPAKPQQPLTKQPQRPLFGGRPPVVPTIPPPLPPPSSRASPEPKRQRCEEEGAVDDFDSSDVEEMEIDPPPIKPAAAPDASQAGSKPSTAIKSVAPPKRLTKLPPKYFEELVIGLSERATATHIPADLLVPVAGHVTETRKLSVVFIPTAAQRAQIHVLPGPPRKAPSPDDYVFGVYVLVGPEVRAILPGTAILIHPTKKTDEPAARYAMTANGIGQFEGPQPDESLEQVMDRLFDDMRIDFIPSLMGEANVDFGINLYKLIDEADENDELANKIARLLVPTRNSQTTPWNLMVDDERSPFTLLSDALSFVMSHLEPTVKSKPAARKPRAAPKAQPAAAASDKPRSEQKPAATKDKAKAAASKPAASKDAVKPKEEEKKAPLAVMQAPEVPRAASSGSWVVRLEPKGLMDTIIVPSTVKQHLPSLFKMGPRVELCEDGCFNLCFGPQAVPASVDAELREQMLAKASFSFVKKIRGLPIDSSGLAIDPSNMTQPVTVMQPDGTSVTGTYVAFETVPSPMYKLIIELLLEANSLWASAESEDEEEEEDVFEDDEEEEEDD